MNSVQKNFKKQMNRSLKKMKKENKDMYYNYLKKNHIHNPEMENRGHGILGRVLSGIKRILATIIATTFFIIILLILVLGADITRFKDIVGNIKAPSSRSIGSNLSINKQQDIIKYLNQVTPLENEIIGDANKRANDLTSYNNKMITAKEYLNNLEVYKNRIEKNLSNINQLNCPNELFAYKTEIQNHYMILTSALQNETKYLQTKNANYLNESQKQYKVVFEESQNKKALLNNILDQNGIKHN